MSFDEILDLTADIKKKVFYVDMIAAYDKQALECLTNLSGNVISLWTLIFIQNGHYTPPQSSTWFHVSYMRGNNWYQVCIEMRLMDGTRSRSFTCRTRRTVYMMHPWCGFPPSIARQARGCLYQTIRMSLESYLRAASNADLFWHRHYLFQLLWRYRPWKIGPGGCDVLYTVLYGTLFLRYKYVCTVILHVNCSSTPTKCVPTQVCI